MTAKLEYAEQPAHSCGRSGRPRTAGHTQAKSPDEEPLLAEQTQRLLDGVGAHTQFGREVPGRRQSLAGQRFALVDRATDLRGDLLRDDRRLGSIAIHITPVPHT